MIILGGWPDEVRLRTLSVFPQARRPMVGFVCAQFGCISGALYGTLQACAATILSSNNWDEATIRHNMLSKYRHDQINGTAFDLESCFTIFPRNGPRMAFRRLRMLHCLTWTGHSLLVPGCIRAGGAEPQFVELPVFKGRKKIPSRGFLIFRR